MRFRFYAGLFFVTAATLMLQTIETRILSVITWYFLAFFIISVAMFGLTAGAVWVYLKGARFSEKTLSHDLSYFSAAFAVTTMLSVAVQMTLSPGGGFSVTWAFVWMELCLCLSIPFFFSGVVISLALTRSPYPVGRVYGVDLVGAAAGCFGALLLLNCADGPSAVIWVSSLVAVGAALFSGSGVGGAPDGKTPFAWLLRRPGTICAVLTLCALANGATRYGIQPRMVKGEPEKRFDYLLYEKWNSFSRVTAYAADPNGPPLLWAPSPKLPQGLKMEGRFFRIDGLAGTTMFRFTGNTREVSALSYDLTNLAYSLPGLKRGAVIGVGGGRDVLSALIFGLKDVTGVEINPIFIRLLTTNPDFADYANLNKVQGAHFVVDEARSWFARSNDKFDIIQMSMADTWAATGAGAFTLAENGLYTVEAWKILMSRLNPRGFLTVSRWYGKGDINETGRMISLAAATLMEMGVSAPEKHIFLASDGSALATLVLARSAFSQDDINVLEKTNEAYGFVVLASPKKEPDSIILQGILNAKDRTTLDKFTSSLPLDLTPPTDERPFFFNQLPFNRPFQMLKMLLTEGWGVSPIGVVSGNIVASLNLVAIFILSMILALATIIAPLRTAVRNTDRALVAGGTAYFFLIGAGFMAIEIGLLQRMSVFLGHPVYSIGAVLFTLILTTGIGSFVQERLKLDRRAKFVIWAILLAGYILIMAFRLPGILAAFDSSSLPARIVICVLAISPAGLMMGFGFPTGMRLISEVDAGPTPWFWGINGAAGVFSSVISIILSIAFGIGATLIAGAICYILLIPAAFSIGFKSKVFTRQGV